jgi:Taurine catabolism dioxygenase TauD, TfdA family
MFLFYKQMLFFYCDVAPPEGGETPIALSHMIHRLMAEREPEFVSRLAAEGLRYVRVAPEESDLSSALGRGWKSTFFAETREEAELNAKKVPHWFACYILESFSRESRQGLSEVCAY